MRYALRRISPLSALLYGLVLGLAAWLIPGIALGWLVREAVARLQGWLTGLRFVLPIPLTDGILIDLAALLNLTDTQQQLASLAARDTALVLSVALGTAAAGMLLTGLMALAGALIYNLLARLFGGIEVTLSALDVPRGERPIRTAAVASAAKTAPAAVPPPAANTTRPAKPTPHAWLVPTTAGERLPLREDITRIGAAPTNDIVLPGLSPEHAEIRRESGRYLIYDLGSRRTWVNDAQVAAVHMLKDGFRLQLGQSEFLVQIVTV